MKSNNFVAIWIHQLHKHVSTGIRKSDDTEVYISVFYIMFCYQIADPVAGLLEFHINLN